MASVRKSHERVIIMTKRNINTEILKMAFIVVAIPTMVNFLSRPDKKLEKEFLLVNLKLYALAFMAMFVSVAGLMFLFFEEKKSINQVIARERRKGNRTGI